MTDTIKTNGNGEQALRMQIERLRGELRGWVALAQRIEQNRKEVPYYGESSEFWHDLEAIKDMAAHQREQP